MSCSGNKCSAEVTIPGCGSGNKLKYDSCTFSDFFAAYKNKCSKSDNSPAPYCEKMCSFMNVLTEYTCTALLLVNGALDAAGGATSTKLTRTSDYANLKMDLNAFSCLGYLANIQDYEASTSYEAAGQNDMNNVDSNNILYPTVEALRNKTIKPVDASGNETTSVAGNVLGYESSYVVSVDGTTPSFTHGGSSQHLYAILPIGGYNPLEVKFGVSKYGDNKNRVIFGKYDSTQGKMLDLYYVNAIASMVMMSQPTSSVLNYNQTLYSSEGEKSYGSYNVQPAESIPASPSSAQYAGYALILSDVNETLKVDAASTSSALYVTDGVNPSFMISDGFSTYAQSTINFAGSTAGNISPAVLGNSMTEASQTYTLDCSTCLDSPFQLFIPVVSTTCSFGKLPSTVKYSSLEMGSNTVPNNSLTNPEPFAVDVVDALEAVKCNFEKLHGFWSTYCSKPNIVNFK